MDILYVIGGFIILLLAGDALVRGAVGLSLKLGIPALIVSLTIVAFGTSAPELLISIKAAMDDAAGFALDDTGNGRCGGFAQWTMRPDSQWIAGFALDDTGNE